MVHQAILLQIIFNDQEIIAFVTLFWQKFINCLFSLAFAPDFRLNPVRQLIPAARGGEIIIHCQPRAAPKALILWTKGTELLRNSSRQEKPISIFSLVSIALQIFQLIQALVVTLNVGLVLMQVWSDPIHASLKLSSVGLTSS